MTAPQHYLDSLTRAQQIIRARASSEDAARDAELEIAARILGDDEALGWMESKRDAERPFELMEIVGRELEVALSAYATDSGLKTPASSAYDPLFAGERTFRALWRLCRIIDKLHIDHAFYVRAAVEYWASLQNGRMPRLTQLSTHSVVSHVTKAWMRSGSRQQ